MASKNPEHRKNVIAYLRRLRRTKAENASAAETSREPPEPRRLKRPPVVRDIMPPAPTAALQRAIRESPPAAPAEARPEPPPRQVTSSLRPREPELAIRTWEPELLRRGRIKKRLMLATGGGAAAIGFILATFVFPKFSIVLHPNVRSIAVPRTELTADTAAVAADAAGRRIPAILIETEKTSREEYASSGTKFIRERARGTLTLYNAYSSAPQTLVANTRLQDPSGKVFRLSAGVTVPGAKVAEGAIVPTSINATVVADEPGEQYNIEPTQFRIPGFRGTPKYQGFSAASTERFGGGFVGEARVIESADLTRASEDLTRRVVAALQDELRGAIPPDQDFISPDGAREVTVTRIDTPRAGERSERFLISVTARGRLIVTRRSHLTQALAALLLPKDGQPPPRVGATQPGLVVSEARFGLRPGELRMTISGELAYWHETNTNDLAAILRTSTPRKAEAYLRGREEVESFRIKRFPRWLWYIPGRTGGLDVRIQPPG